MRFILAVAALSAVGANELVPRFLSDSGFCATIGTPPTQENGQACTCKDTKLGFETGCSVTQSLGYTGMPGAIPVTITVESSFLPCGDPASMGYSATGDFNGVAFTLAEQTVGAGHTSLIPVPGASKQVPGLGGVGLYLAASLTGNAADLKADIGMTLCLATGGSAPTLDDCSTPIPVLPETTFPSFSDACAEEPSNSNGHNGSDGSGNSGSSGMGGGAIAGIVIGVLAGVGVIAGAVYYRNKNAAASSSSADSASAKGEEVENPASGNNL